MLISLDISQVGTNQGTPYRKRILVEAIEYPYVGTMAQFVQSL